MRFDFLILSAHLRYFLLVGLRRSFQLHLSRSLNDPSFQRWAHKSDKHIQTDSIYFNEFPRPCVCHAGHTPSSFFIIYFHVFYLFGPPMLRECAREESLFIVRSHLAGSFHWNWEKCAHKRKHTNTTRSNRSFTYIWSTPSQQAQRFHRSIVDHSVPKKKCVLS